MMVWIAKHPRARPDMLGFIPEFFNDEDPRPAREQIHEAYRHGGGWRPFTGFELLPDDRIRYPGDPPYRMLFETVLHSETDKPEVIRLYEFSWLMIMQRDGSSEIARVD